MDTKRARPFLFWLFLGMAIALGILAVTNQVAGCRRGDMELSTVLEGQPAPHRGWNFGPDSWVETGELVKVGGVVIRIQGLDPNDLSGE